VTAQLAFDFPARGIAPVGAIKPSTPETTRRLRGRVAYLSGAAAEEIAARSYERRGLNIACRRWRGPAGEIDLVIEDGDALVFVEVKKSRTFSGAAERLTAAQMRRIYKSAESYLADAPLGQLSDVRFDVVLVNEIGDVRIIENAFGQE